MTVCFCYDTIDAALYRMSIYYLMNAMNNNGEQARAVDVRSHHPGDADVYVFYRTTLQSSLGLMKQLRADGKFVVYSIDDYVFEFGCRYGIPGVGREFFLECFRVANVVAASNSRLLSHIPTENKIRYSTSLDEESTVILLRKPKVTGAPFTFAWLAGTNHHGMDSFVQEFLWHLDNRLSVSAVFHRFGRHLASDVYHHIEIVNHEYVPVEQWRDLYRKYSELSFDATISPLPEDEEFCHCKTELKYVESSAMGVPVVVSRMAQFKDVICDGVNGFFASSPEEFADKIALLSTNSLLARQTAENSRAHVLLEYSSRKCAVEFLESIRAAMKLGR